MSDSKTIVVSPSGKYYGSEQMLHEHLIFTKKKFRVFVKSDGDYFEILKKSKMNHTFEEFSNVILLYLNIFFLLLFKDYKSVYLNEGGHIRYVKLLAKYFSKKKFIVHVRLVEDTHKVRLKDFIYPNMHLICVSDFIRHEIIKNNPKIKTEKIETVHDYYVKNQIKTVSAKVQDTIRVGVVGRVSSAKGVSLASKFLEYWDNNISRKMECYFYGDVVDSDIDVKTFKAKTLSYSNVTVLFKGFVNDKDVFFDTFDVVIHFNAFEPFPRIYFDAMARIKPVVGFNSGGIKEQAAIFDQENKLVDLFDGWPSVMSHKIITVHDNLERCQNKILEKHFLFKDKLNVFNYMTEIEKYFD